MSSKSMLKEGILGLAYTSPYLTMWATLLVRTVVLPEPAPASTKTGPWLVKTASLCIELSLLYLDSIILSLSSMKLLSKSFLVIYPQPSLFIIYVLYQSISFETIINPLAFLVYMLKGSYML